MSRRRRHKPLSDAYISKLKPWVKPEKYYDHGAKGLYLHVSEAGRKTWRFRYSKGGKEFTIRIGVYTKPATDGHVGLADARSAAIQYQAQIANGGHPAEKPAPTPVMFRAAVLDYLERATEYRARSTVSRDKLMHRYCASIDDRDISDLKPSDLRKILDGLKDRPESQRKMKHFLNRVFTHAVALGWRDRNPMVELAKLNYGKKVEHKSRPAITDPKRFGELLRMMDGYTGHEAVCTALKVLPLVALRPGELRGARWKEIDFESNLWTIPASRMKGGQREHVVPLSKQVAVLLWDLHMWTDNGPNSLVFSMRDKPISENTINGALRRLGIDTKTEHTAHGFRASFSTLANEKRKDSDLIEMALSHAGRDRIKKIYDRSTLLDDRRKLMQWWANYCDSLRKNKT